jgi:hypothetical protein
MDAKGTSCLPVPQSRRPKVVLLYEKDSYRAKGQKVSTGQNPTKLKMPLDHTGVVFDETAIHSYHITFPSLASSG